MGDLIHMVNGGREERGEGKGVGGIKVSQELHKQAGAREGFF